MFQIGDESSFLINVKEHIAAKVKDVTANKDISDKGKIDWNLFIDRITENKVFLKPIPPTHLLQTEKGKNFPDRERERDGKIMD